MRKIVLSIFAILLLSFTMTAQNLRVSGTVTDSDGAPIVGVVVVLKGTTTAVVTNNDGQYSIDAPANTVLVFSCLGMVTQEINIASRTVINVQMKVDAIIMSDVVVTAIGINRAERSLGYSVSKVDASEAVQRAEPDMLRSLEGKVPGVMINAPSGAAGSSTRVTIRGSNSFFGNNQPLYIVDGVPYSNTEVATSNQGSGGGGSYGSSIANLDANDIGTMTVLKSAAAAALYGSRASNGVVVITTKSGAVKKAIGAQKGLEITFNAGYTVEKIGALPVFQNKYGQGSNFDFGTSNGSWGPAFGSPGNEYLPDGIFTDIVGYYPNWAEETFGEGGKIPYRAYNNNVKDLFDTGGIFEASLNVSSINDKGNFGATVSRTLQDSYVPEAAYEKFSFSVGGNQNLFNGVRVGGNVSYTRSIQDGSMLGNNQSQDVAVSSLARAFVMPRNWNIQQMPWQTPDGANLMGNLTAQANNPYWGWKNNTIHTIEDRSVANFRLGYDFTSWLSADYTIGYNHWAMDRKEVINIGSRGMANGRIRTVNYASDEIESVLTVSGKFELMEGLRLNAIAGHNINQRTATSRNGTGTDIINPGVFSIGNTKTQTMSESYSRRAIWGLFADVGLDYKSWAFLNVTGRNDWSSTLPKAHRSYFYPSVSASFIFTEALDLRNNILDFGKLRASWGKVGSDASPYYYNDYFDTGAAYMGQGPIYVPSSKYDEKLKPEFTREVEVGLDMAFLRSRISLEFTYYNKRTQGQIASKTTPPTTGTTDFTTNFGEVANRGIEIGANFVPILTSYGLKWSIYGTFTKNKSEVMSLSDGLEEVRLVGGYSPYMYAIVGEPMGIMKGSVLARDDKGNPLVDPASGFYIIATDEGFVGDPNPKYRASVTNTLNFKGFTFNFMFDFQKGGCVVSSYLTDLLGRGVTKDTEDRLGARILPGVLGNNTTKQALRDAEGNTIRNYINLNESDLWFSSSSAFSSFAINGCDEVSVYDATTLRLSEVSIGYMLPAKWFEKISIGSVHVSAVGRNLWFHAPNVPKYSNYDPTANSYGASNQQGYDYTGIPRSKRYGFNINVTF